MGTDPEAALPAESGLREYTQWIYGLQGLSVLVGLFTARSIALRLAIGLPSILAVVMNYLRRAEARGSWLESHFGWQIRTFWYTWLWILVVSIISMPLLIVGIGFLIAIVGLALIGLWVIYRVVRGWVALREGRAMPLPP